VEERSKRRDGRSGEMFEWENMKEGEEEEWGSGEREGQRGLNLNPYDDKFG